MQGQRETRAHVNRINPRRFRYAAISLSALRTMYKDYGAGGGLVQELLRDIIPQVYGRRACLRARQKFTLACKRRTFVRLSRAEVDSHGHCVRSPRARVSHPLDDAPFFPSSTPPPPPYPLAVLRQPSPHRPVSLPASFDPGNPSCPFRPRNLPLVPPVRPVPRPLSFSSSLRVVVREVRDRADDSSSFSGWETMPVLSMPPSRRATATTPRTTKREHSVARRPATSRSPPPAARTSVPSILRISPIRAASSLAARSAAS